MADVFGPNSYLPGQKLPPLNGSVCDHHHDRLAVNRVIGESDSMGSEVLDLCQECIDETNKPRELAEGEVETSWCDLCKAMVNERTEPMRDPEEGSCGPVYQLCRSHRKTLRDFSYNDYGDEE